MGMAIAIGCDQFRWPTMGAKPETQFMPERRLRHAQIAFRLIEKISEMNSRVSVSEKGFPRGPKFVRYETNRKQR
jgi:hypothetical protein